MRFRLQHTAGHRVYSETGGRDDHGNEIPVWAAPVDVPAIWWPASTSEPQLAGHDRVVVDMVAAVASSLAVSPHDRLVLDTAEFEVIGAPSGWDRGPGRRARRKLLNLRRVDG
ncbi:hypothetical protein ACWFRF_20840 [Nocardia sp. NPDC055165]